MTEIKLKKVRQSSGLCGPASLVSLLDFYGLKMSERELASLCGASKKYGTEPEDLVRVLENLGFKVVAKRLGTWGALKRLVIRGTPVLVDWWSDYGKPADADGHYSVVYKMTDDDIYMMDPDLGDYRRMSKEHFVERWYDFYLTGKKNLRWYMYIAK